MKKLLLLVIPALLFACVDYTDDFNVIDERLDKLEQNAIPSIEEQIESINTQLASLKETDNAIKAQIAELEKSDKATATEIANLKSKDSELEKSISDLQKYVDTQIANAKSEAAAAYATIEQYNNIVSQLSAVQSSTDKLSEELTAKINAEVKNLTDKITDLENRIKAVEEKIENLMVRIQSVSYMPEYADGKVLIERKDSVSSGILSFRISPKDVVAELAKVWKTALSCEAYYPKTRTISLVKLAITEFEGDVESGVVTIKVSGNGLSDEFFAGTQEAKIALVISDGNNQIVSDYADAYGHENFGEQLAEISVSPATITTTFEGTHESLQITSNADWIVSCEQTDVILSARVGRGNGTVDVEIPAATAARNFVIKFIASKMTTVAGMNVSTTQKFDVQVSQNATGTNLDDYLFHENCGEDVKKNSEGYWPYVDAFEGWNPQGDAAANVAYKGNNASVRTSGSAYQPTADAVGVSGAPYVFVNKVPSSANFVIENIAVTGGSSYIFTFNVSCQKSYISYPLFATVDGSLIHLELGYDGVNWDAVDCTYTPNGGNGWYAVQTEFKVKADATVLYARFTYEAPASNGGGRFDDFKLVAGGNGAEIAPEAPQQPELIVTAYEAYSPYKVKFNVKNANPSIPVKKVVFAANETREFASYMSMYDYTYGDIVLSNDGYANLSSAEIAEVNSDFGYDMEFDVTPNTFFTLAAMGWNNEGRPSDPDKEGSKAVAEARSTAMENAAPLDMTKLNALKGDWTATATVKTYDYNTGNTSSAQKSWKVTIGDLNTNNTLSAADYAVFENAGVNKVATDAYLAQFNELAAKYNASVLGQNRVLCQGWDLSGTRETSTASPWDLFLMPDYNASLVDYLFNDFGPKWFLQTDADGNIFVPVNYNRIQPLTRWYNGMNHYLCLGNYELGYANYIDPNNPDSVQSVGIPVEISANGNTVTLKAVTINAEGQNISLYPTMIYDNQGQLAFYNHYVVSEVVLTKGWNGGATPAPAKASSSKSVRGKMVANGQYFKSPAKVFSRTALAPKNNMYSALSFSKHIL